MKRKVLVLGGSGMLGSMVTDWLARDAQLAVTATVRTTALKETLAARVPEVAWRILDADAANLWSALSVLDGYDWVIDAIGVTNRMIHDGNAVELERAVRINSEFPHVLARAAERAGASVLRIATDCVWSGQKGNYTETDPHDALDVYGKTKSLGEVPIDGICHLRCSIIGPEPKDYKFLLEWFLAHPRGGRVTGYQNHRWTGITTLHFARLCQGIIHRHPKLDRLQHIVPSGSVTKCELLATIAECYGRQDIDLIPTESYAAVDRTLCTNDPQRNASLWAAAGYQTPPTVAEMVRELAGFDYRMARPPVSDEAKRAS